MKKNTIKFLSSFCFCAAIGILAVSVAQSNSIKATQADEVPVSNAIDADLNRFNIRYPVGGVGSQVVDNVNKKITYNGGWDSNFLVTDQFDTQSKDYSFSASVVNPTYSYASETAGGTYFGLNLYIDTTTYISFYMKWYKNPSGQGIIYDNETMFEGIYLNHVGGAWDQVYASAIVPENQDWTVRGTFTDLYGDNYFVDEQGSKINLFTGSKITPNLGFDVTFHVERKMYKNRLADIIQMEIDAFAEDGVTPAKFLSLPFAVDAFTNALGANDSRSQIKPQIGFATNTAGWELSNIQFANNEVADYSSTIRKMGVPEAVNLSVDYANETVTLDNTHVCGGGAVLNSLDLGSHNFRVDADISGDLGKEAQNAVGYTIYYNDHNFVNIFYEWDGACNTINGVVFHFVINDKVKEVTHLIRNPWGDNIIGSEEWANNYSDYGGWVSDAYIAEGQDANFNNFRTQCPSLTISDGFNMKLIHGRMTRNNHLYDEMVLVCSATGSDGKVHNWTTCAVDYDGFTYPNGGTEASPLIDVVPTVALYARNATGAAGYATFSNIKVNGQPLDFVAPDSLTLEDQTTVFIKGDTFSFDGKVTINYDDESTRVIGASEYSVSSPDMTTLGTKTVTVTLNEKTDVTKTYDIDVVELDSIEVVQAETQTVFAVGDDFVGPKVNASFTNGTSSFGPTVVSSDVTCTGYDMNKGGEQTVSVSYSVGGVTKNTSYNITVINGLKSIAVSDEKTAYKVGDTFVMPTVTATYANGDTSDVSSSATASGYNMDLAGQQTVTVSYVENLIERTTTYTINVEANLTGIAVDKTGHDSFKVGDSFTKAAVTASYDGSKASADVTSQAEMSGYDMDVAGEQTVSVSYTEGGVTKTAEYTINVAAVLQGIELSEKKVEYMVGDEFVMPTVTASYNGGQASAVVQGATASGYNMSKAESQKVVVSYTEGGVTKTAEYDIEVFAKLNGLNVVTAKKNYFVGDEFVKPTVVSASYIGQANKNVAENVTYTGFDKTKVGEQTITASYTEHGITKTATYKVTVSAKLSSIVIGQDCKTVYTQGEEFIRPTITAKYDGKADAVVEAEYSGYDMSKTGEQTVVVSYTEAGITKTAEYKITVNAKGGCGGSVIASSAVISGLALAGIALLVAKRKKDD